MTGKKYNTDGTQGLSASIKKQNIDAAAPLTEVLYPNGTKAMYTYDKAENACKDYIHSRHSGQE